MPRNRVMPNHRDSPGAFGWQLVPRPGVYQERRMDRMPNLALGKLVLRIDEWQRKNPSLTWRRKENVTRANIALLIGCPYMTFRDYETGRAIPTTHVFVGLAKLMNKKPESVRGEWESWMSQKPRALEVEEAPDVADRDGE